MTGVGMGVQPQPGWSQYGSVCRIYLGFELTAHLNLKDAVHVGHSTGGGEVARYIGRHGTQRVAKVVLIGGRPYDQDRL